MKILKRIYHLLQAEERRKLMKMAVTVFFSALLNFAGLAALLPLLYFLLYVPEILRYALNDFFLNDFIQS